MSDNVLLFRTNKALNARGALAYLRRIATTHPDGVIEADSVAHLGTMLNWERSRTSKQLAAWKRSGKVTVDREEDGRVRVRVLPERLNLGRTGTSKSTRQPKGTKRTSRSNPTPSKRDKKRDVTEPVERDETRDGKRASEVSADRDNPANCNATETTYAERVAKNTAQDARVNPTPDTSAPTAENTSVTKVSSAVMEAPDTAIPDRAQEHSGTAVERATERPVWRRGGGGVTGGGGGFDAVETFSRASMAERILILIAAGLSATAAYMSVTGMVVMYPFEPTVIMVFGALIEAAKFFGFGVLAAGWAWYGGFSRLIAAGLLLVAATINASGVYGRLISDHVGPAADRTATYTTADAGQGAKVEVAQGRVADLDRRIAQIDDAISAATRRGRTNSAMRLAAREQRNRAQLAGERDRAQQELSGLKAGRTSLGARHQEAEASSTPVKYAAALFEDFGLLKPGTDPEKLMRWISFLILLTGDPLALALIWTMNSRTRRQGGV